jgi:hypothetical protein
VIKLSEPDFYLPVIHALEPGRIFESGRTKPMQIRGVCEQTNEKGDYVVKLKGADHMWPGSNLYELLASFIATELNFKAPQPALILITEPFLEVMKLSGHKNFIYASKSLGLNFGTALQEGYQEVILGQALPVEVKDKLIEMFALDVFLGNSDRRFNKPNFLSNGKEVLTYDHELAFGFILELFKNPEPWIIRPSDLNWLADNYCYRYLKGNDFDFSNFATRLNGINEAFWQKAEAVIPAEWQNEHFTTIKNYLGTIVEHKEQFASELKRVLS